MGDMSSASNLSWVWIIEYLFSMNQVSTSILHDLIHIAPNLPDNIGKNAGEVMALRLLEELFGKSSKATNPDAPDTRVSFDLSESCEHVLKCILQESSVEDLRKTGPELSKWDVHPFIRHKRATLPKCALQQLKDKILEDVHPYAADLKESSGLAPTSGSDQVTLHDDHDVRAPRVDESGSKVQVMSHKNNSDDLILENDNGVFQGDLREGNLLSSKRGKSDLTSEDLVGPVSVNQDGDHFQGLVVPKNHSDKIIWHDGDYDEHAPRVDESGSKVQVMAQENNFDDLIIEKENGIFQGDLREGNLLPSKRGKSDLASEDLVGPVSVNQDSTVGHDDMHLNPKKLRQDDHDVLVDEDSDLDNEIEQDMNPKEAKADSEHTHDEELSDDEFHSEKIVDMKNNFLSSKCTSGQHLSGTANETQQNCCVKCNRDSQLLVCSTSCCPVLVHERCLGFPAKFDNNGSFYCPFCAYCRYISEYTAAKKKASLVKKKASLARNKLATFINVGMQNCSKDLRKIQENRHSGKRKCNQTSPNSDGLSCQFQRSKGKEVLKPQITDPTKKPTCAPNIDGEETESENDNIYSTRDRRQNKKLVSPEIPQLRRKPLPWTAEEEEMLREGVQVFAGDGGENFPWTKIFNFGASVFSKNGRTTIDLKDKWRNMCKGRPKHK